MARHARRRTRGASELGSGWRRARTSRTDRGWRPRWPDFPGVSAAWRLGLDVEPHLKISLKVPFQRQSVILRQDLLQGGRGGIGLAVFELVMRQHQPDPQVMSGNGIERRVLGISQKIQVGHLLRSTVFGENHT